MFKYVHEYMFKYVHESHSRDTRTSAPSNLSLPSGKHKDLFEYDHNEAWIFSTPRYRPDAEN